MCLIIINKLINNNIVMNESISIFLATTILALGGLGLYMYKSSDDKVIVDDKDNNEEYNEESLFGSGSFFNWGTSDDNTENDDKLEECDEEIKPRKRGPKTYKNRKSTGSSRRRY